MDKRLRPVERRTLVSVVQERLLEYLQSGELQPGDALPSQAELARTLSVSLPVLREAMQRLASLGHVDIRPGSGCYVREPEEFLTSQGIVDSYTHESALEVLEARMLLEVELAGLAAERATDEDLKGMESALRRIQRSSEQGKSTYQLTHEFHHLLACAAHNTILYRLLHLLRQPILIEGIRVEHSLPDAASHEYDSHLQLFKAIQRGAPATARELMREHLEMAHGWEQEIAAVQEQLSHHHSGNQE